MKNRDRNNLIIGTLAGLAIGYWLNSNQGKSARKKAKKMTIDGMNTAKDLASEQLSTAKDVAGNLIGEAIDTTKSTLHSLQRKSEDLGETIQSSFEKGVSKAKQQVKEMENSLANAELAKGK